MSASSPPVVEGAPAPFFVAPGGEELIRGDLHGPEQLDGLARQLAAASHVIPRRTPGQPLLRRLLDNARYLRTAHKQIRVLHRRDDALPTDAAWLLDNFHIIEDVLREVRQDLPRGYYEQLPKLAYGALTGYPRVYALALALVAHTDSSLDEAHILRFVQAYQSVAPLTIGELWAVPTMLRLSLIENLRRLSQHMLGCWRDRDQASQFARSHWVCPPDRRCTPPDCPLTDAFTVHLLRSLRDAGKDGEPGVEWLEQRLLEAGSNVQDVVRRESQRQAANQICIGNCVTSLRVLAALDWTAFFEKASHVERVLAQDPSGVYPRQDFGTRDQYRQMVERLSRGSGLAETDVAARAVALAARATQERSRHIGFYLVGPGRQQLQRELGYRPRLRDWIIDTARAHPAAVFFGGLGTVLVLLLGGLAWLVASLGGSAGVLLLALAVALLPASSVAVALVNYLIILVLPPRSLPRFDFKEGIPSEHATFVVVPCLLSRPEAAEELIDRLEIHYLANTDANFYFALLTDFADAPAEHMPQDEACLKAAREGIERLQRQYAGHGPRRFFLLHRRRLFNPSEGCWMGWERKRGKLVEFNRLLRGRKDTSYAYTSCPAEELPHVRYVITLDADTQLPRESARRLVGTLAHPLNRPRFDPSTGRVVEGYAVLQPRVNINMVAAARTPFARIHAGSAGIDPYSIAVSDVYQDLFGSGTYTGKGIYDLDAFEAAVGERFPDNTILSHDLIEGNFARCGLASDVQLLDEYPARYNVWARREHRWVRGDWQILPWLLGTGPAAQGPGLPLLERWKIFDNLRRSLVPAALVVFVVLGWTVLPGSPWVWTLLVLGVLGLPLLLHLLDTVRGLVSTTPVDTLRVAGAELPKTAAQTCMAVSLVVDHARLSLDAVARTLVRLFLTRRHLLEWETAASTEMRLGNGLVHYVRAFASSLLLTVGITVLVALVQPEALPAAAVLLVAWLVAPLVAYWVSQPSEVGAVRPLPASGIRLLHRVARKTWGFFETFVGDQDNWLPPDNYQESPRGVVAHRTSPTNIGLLLLSTLGAHDLGYLSLRRLLDRLRHTLSTLERLERFHGHFLNWYDTVTLEPLPPGYISSVDSGNLLGCLVALEQGLREKGEEPIPSPSWQQGLADTFALLHESLERLALVRLPSPVGELGTLRGDTAEVRGLLAKVPDGLLELADWLERLERRASEMESKADRLVRALHEGADDLRRWAMALTALVRERREELAAIAPWLALLATAPKGSGSGEHVRRWEAVRQEFLTPASVSTIASRQQRLLAVLGELADTWPAEEPAPPFAALAEAVRRSSATELHHEGRSLADRARDLAVGMDFKVLYNNQRHLFSIGHNLGLGRLDPAHYDLLASESALTSFLAVARGDAPRRHWFQLGRPLTWAGGSLALLSWGGTLFEYVMPRLLLRLLPGTLLERSARTAIARQIEYARQRRVPWGISESGFNLLSGTLDYQYQSFGVPGLGLKRGLGRDLVVAPYATGLATMLEPALAVSNFERLRAEGGEGPYGFYEAVDYTPSRLDETQRSAVVRSYMAHHQGMLLVAVINVLLDDPMPRRFHSEPMVRATELLLQERMPHTAPLYQPYEEEQPAVAAAETEVHYPVSRRLTTPRTAHPRTHLLSNGQYTVMITSAGGGFSTWRDLAITRWREDATRDAWGSFIYVRDRETGRRWSAAYQPLGGATGSYEVVFSVDKAEFRRSDDRVETHLEVTVSPEHPAEVRRVTFTNHDRQVRELEVTSYAEVVLAPHGADLAHPAFGKLFVQTEWVAGSHALLCRRRPRSPEQPSIWAVHVLAVEGISPEQVEYETDRGAFLGRGRDPANPVVLESGATLGGHTGAVLDPIVSLRCRVRVEPGTSVSLAFTTAVASSRDEALALADTYHDYPSITRAFELAWARSQVELEHLRLTTEEAHLFQRLAAHLIFASPALRAPADTLTANRQGQEGLWRFGISGDRPIVLVHIKDPAELGLVRQLLECHAYLRLDRLEFDLVLLDEQQGSYFQEVHERLVQVVRASSSHNLVDKPGGIFLRKAVQMSADDRMLFQAAARVVLTGNRGTLAEQIDRMERQPLPRPPADLVPQVRAELGKEVPPARPEGLLFDNGFGGFLPDGREYLITADPGQRPPAPWVNVIANRSFGFLITESGLGCTWCGNSQLNRLTPWSNDPVSDPPGEVIYLRDETTGAYWTVPHALRGTAPWLCRHGQGTTRFEQTGYGLAQELLLLVPAEAPIKLMRLRVRNLTAQRRQLSATFYAEWVLGTVRDRAPMQVWCAIDPSSGALLAFNPFSSDAGSHVAFADVNLRPRSVTADRTEFLGRNGHPAQPAAMGRTALSGRVEPGCDPCAALQAPFEIDPGEQVEILFLLGQTGSIEEARLLLAQYRQPGNVDQAVEEVRRLWDGILGMVQVRTPDPALDLLLNRWLLYQTLCCRVWGRTAFYQSGGAYGFRDQLQDGMALAVAAPQETRAHLLRAAAHQFLEGDVQHWWHPPSDKGVRTRISDDFLWLPLAVAHYVETTGDVAILDERVSFLQAPVLRPEQEEEYGQPTVAGEAASLYEHCVRAIGHGMRFGALGLPLMGTGDWNDGMNRVGAEGRGETVWGGWFLITVLDAFAALAQSRGDNARAEQWRGEAQRLHHAIEEHAWDGAWYWRATFDDGTPLGAAHSPECRIDSLPQTWAVISGRADPDRARQALAAVDRWLIRREDGLVLLFTPPFDGAGPHPGYVRGYLPGIRENGGQYTHAATWVVRAAAWLGQGDLATEVLGMLNPVRHALTAEQAQRYRVEPYVVAADVYGVAPHIGRGGWTWYTGSAGWLYRVALEDVLGFRVQGDRLALRPAVSVGWNGHEIIYRYRSATYHIRVERSGGGAVVRTCTVDGATCAADAIPLSDDGRTHEVHLVLGDPAPAEPTSRKRENEPRPQ